MIQAIEWIVVVVGVVSVVLAMWKCWFFARINTRLSRALSLDVGSEFISVGATTAFAASAALSQPLLVNETGEILVRLAILSSAALTTWNLSRAFRAIEKGEK